MKPDCVRRNRNPTGRESKKTIEDDEKTTKNEIKIIIVGQFTATFHNLLWCRRGGEWLMVDA